jgi:methanogenic corrinoid protein MtbC1
MSDEPQLDLPPVDPAEAGRPHPATLSPELLAGLLVDGDDELAAWVIRDAMAERSRPEVYDGIVREAMRIVGDGWVDGRWSVADEHLASQTLLRALERVRPHLGPEGRVGPLAVLAGVAGERHVIALVCLDHVLQEAGWTVANLGADVPAEDLARFIGSNEAVLVAVGASDPGRADTVVATVAAARAARSVDPPLTVMIGGRVAEDPASIAAARPDWAGISLAAAAAFARERGRQVG